MHIKSIYQHFFLNLPLRVSLLSADERASNKNGTELTCWFAFAVGQHESMLYTVWNRIIAMRESAKNRFACMVWLVLKTREVGQAL